MTEYLYDRDDPKSHFRQKITGVQGLYYGVPNINERAEMIARSLLKENEGNLTKFAVRLAAVTCLGTHGEAARPGTKVARVQKHRTLLQEPVGVRVLED